MFDRATAPLLARTVIKDAVLAPLIDTLSRRAEKASCSWIDYRDLSVFCLGSIYARALGRNFEHTVLAAASNTNRPEVEKKAVIPENLIGNFSDSCVKKSSFIELFFNQTFTYDIGCRAVKKRQLRAQKNFSQTLF